jgi:AcrR family transcriptional regulator
MPKPTVRSPARHEMVIEQLMEAAEHLFARKGVAGTSLQELAAAIGLTRTSLYHYVRNKDEMLAMLVEGFTFETADDMRRLADDVDRPAVDRLREGIGSLVRRVAENPRRFRLILTSESQFPEDLGKRYRKARRETSGAVVDLVAQGIREGSLRTTDPEMAAFGLIGAANWVAFWYPRPSGPGSRSPEVIAAEIADNVVKGLSVDGGRQGGTDVGQVVGQLEEDLGRLKHLLREQ